MSSLKIIFEDDQLLVLDKPPGISVTDEGVPEGEETVAKILDKDFNIKASRSGIVHRLDKDTSGILLIAKTDDIAQKLKDQFQQRQVQKTYLSLVHGLVEKEGVVEGAIVRNPQNRFKFSVDEEGKDAVTEYNPLQKFQISNFKFQIIFEDLNKKEINKIYSQKYNQFTLLECHPKTGRTHQIRVHLKYIGFPIVGDEKYVGRKTARLDHLWCPRQFLHAQRLKFTHPLTGEVLSLESPLPEDLLSVLSNLTDLNG